MQGGRQRAGLPARPRIGHDMENDDVTTGEMTLGEAPVPVATERRYRRFGLHRLRMGFRHWRRTRPFWGGLWSILGGAIIAYGPLTAYKLLLVTGTTVVTGIAVGLLVAIFGLFLWFAPALRQITAVLIVLLSVVSLITSDFGGFLIGMALGITGGAMGFAWVPAAPKVRKRRLFRRHAAAVAPPDTVIAVTGTALATAAVEKVGEEVERLPAEPAPAEGGDAAAEPAASGQRGRFRRFRR
jgi:hypothetical protein